PHTATAITSNSGKLIDISAIYLQHREERFLRDFDVANLLHALLTGLLLFQQLALTTHIAAVALGKNVLAQRLDRTARHDLPAKSGLNRDVEHLPWDEFFHLFDQDAPLVVRIVTV